MSATGSPACAGLRALRPSIASDEDLLDALDLFASRALRLGRISFARAVLEGVDLVGDARPEWTESQCANALLVSLRTHDRLRADAMQRREAS